MITFDYVPFKWLHLIDLRPITGEHKNEMAQDRIEVKYIRGRNNRINWKQNDIVCDTYVM